MYVLFKKPLSNANLNPFRYAVLGIALSFALTFSLTEFLNIGLCDKCCNTDFENNPLIGDKKQVEIVCTQPLADIFDFFWFNRDGMFVWNFIWCHRCGR